MNKKILAILLLLMIVLVSATSCSSSGGYNGGYEQWKKDNNYGQKNDSSYDRHFSNDEIHDFVNNYGGKW